MPRDYKHRAQRRRKRAPVSPWLGVIAGLLIGLFVAFLVYIKMQADTLPAPPVTMEIPAPAASEPQQAPAEHGPAESGAPPRPRFRFYSLLPEMEVVVPEQEITGKREQGIPQVEQPGTYFLQVGSFRSAEQADRFRAELALMGLEAGIQKVTINNQDTWHRVRIGPFDNLDNLNRARRQLGEQGIESTLVKIRG